ncbi:MAG: hypothetical protein K9L17_14270 [Clostridiales bacterium]|nr:hypothetical protein [Clostridiales bacterium]
MDEAMEISEKPETEYKLRSWEKEETAARRKGTQTEDLQRIKKQRGGRLKNKILLKYRK